MSNPFTSESFFESCAYRNRIVRCPHKELPASILAARWRMGDGGWTPWTVIDCPLLLAGLIDCDTSCLSQFVDIEK
jgi:hypothetical protein